MLHKIPQVRLNGYPRHTLSGYINSSAGWVFSRKTAQRALPSPTPASRQAAAPNARSCRSACACRWCRSTRRPGFLDQDTTAQVAALKAAGCERIFREKASGGRWDRPQRLRLLNQLTTACDLIAHWAIGRPPTAMLPTPAALRSAGLGNPLSAPGF